VTRKASRSRSRTRPQHPKKIWPAGDSQRFVGAIDELRPILKTVVNLSEIGELSTRKTAETLAYGLEPSKPEPFALAVCCATKSQAPRRKSRQGAVASFLARMAARNTTYQAAFSVSAP